MGFGSSGFGSAPYGYGTPPTAPVPGGSIFALADGGVSGSRLIHHVTRDYVMGDDGRLVGMGDVPQLVLLAVANIKFSGGRLTPATEGDVTRKVTAALRHLVDAGRVKVLGVDFERVGRSGLVTVVRWRDMTSEQEHEVTLG